MGIGLLDGVIKPLRHLREIFGVLKSPMVRGSIAVCVGVSTHQSALTGAPEDLPRMLIHLEGGLIGQAIDLLRRHPEEHPQLAFLPTGDSQGVGEDFTEGTTAELLNLWDCLWPINVHKDEGQFIAPLTTQQTNTCGTPFV